jgi:hypothetical protein
MFRPEAVTVQTVPYIYLDTTLTETGIFSISKMSLN